MQKIINKLIKILVNYKYKKYPFLAWSWSIDEHTDINILSEESYIGWHRLGTHEEHFTDKESSDADSN